MDSQISCVEEEDCLINIYIYIYLDNFKNKVKSFYRVER